MTEVLDKPEIASEVVDRAEIHDGKALVAYTRTEAALADLKARHEGAVFDLRTVAGDKAARAARLELVTLRTGLEKRRKAFKSPFLEAGQLIDSEAKRITAQIEALEKPIDLQITADERRRADEKAERGRIEAERLAAIAKAESERKQAHQDRLAAIAGYTRGLTGMDSGRLANGLLKMNTLLADFEPAGWEEFADRALTALQDAQAAVQSAFTAAKDREDREAEVKRQAAENARIAAENKAEADRIAAEAARVAAEQKAAADKIAAEQKAAADAHAAKVAEFERRQAGAKAADDARLAALAQAEQEAQAKRDQEAAEVAAAQERARVAALPPEPEPEPDGDDCDGLAIYADEPADASETPAAPPPAPDPEPAELPPALKLGAINAWIAPLSITAAGMEQLGFPAAGRAGASVLYHEADKPRIKAALLAHVSALG